MKDNPEKIDSLRCSKVWFRFYEELNDFLASSRRKQEFTIEFYGIRSVKDAIESLGVPHTEVDLILINGISVGFDTKLKHGDRVAVYPMFESLDIGSLKHLRPKPLREPRFVLAAGLNQLARKIRMLGFDALLCYEDIPALITISNTENRVLLTRSQAVLKNRNLIRGMWIRSIDSAQQIREVIDRLDIHDCSPFSRCMECNGIVRTVAFESVKDLVPEGLARRDLTRCEACGKIYWKGSHYDRMVSMIEELFKGQSGI